MTFMLLVLGGAAIYLQSSDEVASSINTIKKPAKSVDLLEPSQNLKEIKTQEISPSNHVTSEQITEKHLPLPKLLTDLTDAGIQLQEYLTAENVGYLETSFYPFTDETDALIKRYANAGEMLLFDNTQSKSYLQGFDKHSGEIVANYFGSGIEAEMIVATSLMLEDGSIEYLVLPIRSPEDGDLVGRVKQSIHLFKTELAKKKSNKKT